MPMRFPYLKAARVKLQERKNACIRSTYESAGRYTGFFLDFIRADPVISTVITELTVIGQEKLADISQHVDGNDRRLRLPDSERECAALYLRLLETIADPNAEIPYFHMIFGNASRGFQDMYDDFFAQVLVPLCSYIDERIDDGDLMLYMLSRYQRECAWFEGNSLGTLIETAESRKLEEVLDQHLRNWLFREGIDYPFSTPKSPSGRADVVVWQGEQPLPLEIKVYDGQDRDLGHISQGLWQAQRYAHDYGKSFGYLVVFNTSPSLLSFENNRSKEAPPCIPVGGLNVFALTIQVGTRPSASKEKSIETKEVKTPAG